MSTPFQTSFRGMPPTDLSLTNLKVNSSTDVDSLFVRNINNIPFADLLSMINDKVSNDVSNDVTLDLSKYNLVLTSPTSLLQTAIDEAYALVLSTSRPAVVYAASGNYTDTTLTLRNNVSIVSISPGANISNLTSLIATGIHYFRYINMISNSSILCNSLDVTLALENSSFNCKSSPSVVDYANGSLSIQLISSRFGTFDTTANSIKTNVGSTRSLFINVLNNSTFRGVIKLEASTNPNITGKDSSFIGDLNGNFLDTSVNLTTSFDNCLFRGKILSTNPDTLISVSNCRLLYIESFHTQVYSALSDMKLSRGECLKASSVSKVTKTTQSSDMVIGVAQTDADQNCTVLIAEGSTPMNISISGASPFGYALEPSNTKAGQADAVGTSKTLATFAVLVDTNTAVYLK
jgi:hypothetical protein